MRHYEFSLNAEALSHLISSERIAPSEDLSKVLELIATNLRVVCEWGDPGGQLISFSMAGMNSDGTANASEVNVLSPAASELKQDVVPDDELPNSFRSSAYTVVINLSIIKDRILNELSYDALNNEKVWVAKLNVELEKSLKQVCKNELLQVRPDDIVLPYCFLVLAGLSLNLIVNQDYLLTLFPASALFLIWTYMMSQEDLRGLSRGLTLEDHTRVDVFFPFGPKVSRALRAYWKMLTKELLVLLETES